MSDTDWLDTEPPAKPTARDLVKADPAFAAMVEHTKGLPAAQRNFLLSFAASHYDPIAAREHYETTFGRKLSARTLSGWMRDDPEFNKAIAMREEIAARISGVSAASVLSSLADIKRRNLGKDDRTAMIALEMIGKHLRMFRIAEDEQQRGVVQTGPGLSITFIHNAGAPQTVRVGEVVDAEVINVPTPGEDTDASK